MLKKILILFILFSTIHGTSYGQSINKETPPPEIIVTYKEGYTPKEVNEKVIKRQQTASQPVVGTLRIAAEDTVSNVLGLPNPELIQEKYEYANRQAKSDSTKPLLNFKPKGKTSAVNSEVITLDNGASVENAVEVYESLPTVESVSINPYMYTQTVPNDQYYNYQWGLTKINAPSAWDTAKGSDQTIVAVIDSGVDYNHPDLAGKIIKGRDFVNNDNDPMDDCGHGTHVAGIIGALTNNNIGVAGVNWNTKILAIKSLGLVSGGCGGTGAIQGIYYAVDNGAKVINMSLGSDTAYPCTSAYTNAISYARQRNVTIIVAAGNSNVDASTRPPANCPGVITVGATSPQDTRSVYSNYGSVVTISAPGGNKANGGATAMILSTFPPSLPIPNACSQIASGYIFCEGTSMATPYVAGAAALLLSVNTNLTPEQVKNILVSSADTLPATNKPIGPRLNLARAVQQASSGQQVTQTPTTIPSTQISQSPQGCDPDTSGASTGIIDFSDLRLARREIAGLALTQLGSCLTTPNSDATNFSDLRKIRRIIAGLENL